MKVLARAKINLTLDILGIRPDGFHQVATVMQSIALHDTLTFTPEESGIDLVVTGGKVSAGRDNLVYRAAELMRERSVGRPGVSIVLDKNIPVEAGLGGGSADAAATILALNDLWHINLPLPELIDLGAGLGSDVPFCIKGGTALALGRGELLKPLPHCPNLGLVLVKPPWGVSTAAVYRAYDQMPGKVKPDTAGMIQAIKEGDPVAIAGKLANALEEPVLTMHPAMAEIKKRLLQAGALGVLMSGSGSTVFGLTPDLSTAEKVAESYQPTSEELILATHCS